MINNENNCQNYVEQDDEMNEKERSWQNPKWKKKKRVKTRCMIK